MHPVLPRSLPLVLIRHSLCAAILAALVGIVDGGTAAARSSFSVATGGVLGGAALLLVGAGVGAFQGLLVGLLGRPARELVARRRRTAGSVGAGAILSFGLSALLGLLVYWLAAEQLPRVKEESLRSVLQLVAVAGALLLQGLLGVLLAPWATHTLQRFERRWGLPFPANPALRVALYGFAPSWLVTALMFSNYGVQLGLLAWLLFAMSFAAAEWLSLSLWRQPAAGARLWFWSAALVLLVVSAAATSQLLFVSFGGARVVSQRARVVPFAVRLMRRSTDFDWDGHSSFFGGRDCAGFDGARSPAELEVAGNGVDEDCDGVDRLQSAAPQPLVRFSSKWTPGRQRPFNILWFIVDSLRTDHCSAYGHDSDTTPYLQQLAAEAWLFEHAYSQSSTTPLSVPSMLSGRWPGRMQWRAGQFPEPDESEGLLPELLSTKGYATTLVQNSWVERKLPFLARGFTSVRTAPAGADWKSGAYAVSNTFLALDEARAEESPFFIAVHVDDVHHPYVGHRGYPLRASRESSETMQDYKRGASLADVLVRLTATHLKNAGLWDETVLVITADHGEEFGEHGGSIHSASCYQEVTHVPLIIRVPGTTPQKIENRVALVDLVPTMLELVGETEHPPDLDGQSLLIPVLEPDVAPADRPIFCTIYQLFSGRKPFFTRSIRDGRHTLIHDAVSDRTELFDSKIDSGEQRDLSAKPEAAAALMSLRARLEAVQRGNLRSISGQ